MRKNLAICLFLFFTVVSLVMPVSANEISDSPIDKVI